MDSSDMFVLHKRYKIHWEFCATFDACYYVCDLESVTHGISSSFRRRHTTRVQDLSLWSLQIYDYELGRL